MYFQVYWVFPVNDLNNCAINLQQTIIYNVYHDVFISSHLPGGIILFIFVSAYRAVDEEVALLSDYDDAVLVLNSSAHVGQIGVRVPLQCYLLG